MSVLAANSHVVLNREVQHQSHGEHHFSNLLFSKSSRLGRDFVWRRVSLKRDFRVEAFWPQMPKPTSSVSAVDMEPINDVQHLDQILLLSQQQSQPIIIDWMAAWCRKCIFLKPKLEKLATEFDSKVKFYCVDVNKVPQTLVKRGNISKMPTIQLWKDCEMKEEVIGGHKAWLVIEEVREMVQKFL